MTSHNKDLINDKTTVKIEDVDESWALKLLNESETEDHAIHVDGNLNSADIHPSELCLIKKAKQQNIRDTHITVEKTSMVETPSAIENQIRAQKLRNEQAEADTKKRALNASLSRIKSFFIA